MVGNEPETRSQNNQDKLPKDENINSVLNLNGTITESDKYFSENEKKSRCNSEASTQVVQFEGVDDKDDSSETSERKLPPIPDGGWGWVVVVAAFLTSACSDGLAYSFGNLHEEFIKYFGQSQAKTSWIGSLFIAIPLISGPIMSALVEQFGCRAMTMTASVVATGGFLLAAISNSVELLCLTLGVVSGLAMGILYVTSVVAVAFWFDKRRTLAVSLASCGIGFGTVIYGPLTDLMLQNYDWRGTLVLLSCTILNMCICGALMRDPDWVIVKNRREKARKKEKKQKLKKSPSISTLSIKSVAGDTVITLNELNELIKSGRDPEHILAILATAVAESEELDTITKMNEDLAHKRNHSTVVLPTFIHQLEKVPPEVMEKILENKDLCNIIEQNYPQIITRKKSEGNVNIENLSNRNSQDSGLHPPSLKTVRAESGEFKKADFDEKSSNPKELNSQNTVRDENNNIVNAKESKTVKNLHSRDEIMYRNPVVHRRALMNMPQHRLRTCSLPDITTTFSISVNSKSETEKKWYHSIVKVLQKNFNFKLFTEFHFLMFNITSVLMSIWSIIPFFFLKSFMSDVDVGGYPTIIIVIGISSGIGIAILGWFGDKPWYNVTIAYSIFLVICGISVATYPFVIEDRVLLIFVSVVFGVSFASSYSYTPAILMELVPIEHFTVGYGMILLSQGVGNLIGPPIGGLIFDVSKSWDLTFIVGGAWLVLSGVCLITIVSIKNFRICGKDPLLRDMVEKIQVGHDKV